MSNVVVWKLNFSRMAVNLLPFSKCFLLEAGSPRAFSAPAWADFFIPKRCDMILTPKLLTAFLFSILRSFSPAIQ